MASGTIKRIITGDMIVSTSNSSSVSVNSGEITEIASITLPEGVWLIMGNADWFQNGIGYRQIALQPSGQSINPSRNSACTTVAIDGKQAYQQIILRSGGGITMKLWGLQNSGAPLMVYPYLCAIALQ